ncbi:MAG: carboxypeptidase-like regulatory domain-containing protein [Cyclobacteriaceae bacterium]|nr:carboxypeptidase-like regulatory domain-containing protein [Cyclobacteriaceae bacterium]
MRSFIRFEGLIVIKRVFFSFILLFSVCALAYGQETIITGKVTDAASGDPIPFVNVVFKGTSVGMTTDFDGKFKIKSLSLLKSDSIVASYIGYKPRSKKFKKGVTQVINFQLQEDVTNLQEVVIKSGENPAFPIMRKIIDNKSINDKRRLSGYEHDTYSKMEIDADNISAKLREKKVMKKIAQVLDSLDRIAGEDGKPILPLFISESVSRIYYRDNPSLKKEFISKSKLTGVMGDDYGDLLAQMIGPSMQDYNFYMNWLNFGKKSFVSPIADGWRAYYDYELLDSAMLGGHFCYRIDFFPKSEQSLAFVGTMWITKQEFALKQIDATMGNKADINFIEKVKIQHEYEQVEGGAWLPSKARVLIDVGELSSNSAGLLAKFYVSNKNFVVNQPKPSSFFDRAIEKSEEANLEEEEKVWDTLRHEPLTETEKNVYHMIDTIRNIPIVRSYIDVLKLIINGYYKTGKVFVGPYLGLLAWNDHEGFRVQAGFKTNIKFSRKWVLGAQLAYGFHDEQFKYQAFVKRILNRKQWTTISFRARHEINRLGLDEDYVTEFPLFKYASRWGRYDKSFYYNEYRATFERELFKGFMQQVVVRQSDFDPTYPFAYYTNPFDIGASPVSRTFQTTEIFFESRYARDQIFLQNDNDRIGLESKRWPVFTIRYTHGFKSEFGDFTYDKVRVNITKRVKMGPLGNGYLNLTGEQVFGRVPYPLLGVHLGNEARIYAPIAFNMMRFGEFASERYASIQYRQNFEGLLLNRLPLIQKLKWRLLATANVLVGDRGNANNALVFPAPADKPQYETYPLNPEKPYMELGYGIENIFKFLRIDVIHRLNYLNVPNSRPIGIFITAQLQL